MLWLAFSGTASAQEARQRQAAAEAYDQGTSAYVAGDYEKAAQWFETANRLSPAAPALIQAARAHQQAGNLARAATLSLQLVETYPDDATATQFGQGVLDELSSKFVRVEVDCGDCALDVDGTLQETHSFFVEPSTTHQVTASFETGERQAEVQGEAGETKTMQFEAPEASPDEPPPPVPITPPPGQDGSAKPLSPVFTFVGIGLTAALIAGSIVSTLDVYSGVDEYEDKASAWQKMCDQAAMPAGNCDELEKEANDLLAQGQSKETRTTVLWVATGIVGAATAIIAVAFTNWSEDEPHESSSRDYGFAVGPTEHGAMMTLKGSF